MQGDSGTLSHGVAILQPRCGYGRVQLERAGGLDVVGVFSFCDLILRRREVGSQKLDSRCSPVCEITVRAKTFGLGLSITKTYGMAMVPDRVTLSILQNTTMP
jgi:hypothetical protein